jgi:DNA-binding CsgD family transcriptional regulator
MTDMERPTSLAGLVSAEADEIYQRLRVSGTLRTGSSNDAVDPHSAGIAELLDLGIAFRSGHDDELIRPVAPAVALRILIEARQHEVVSFQNRILDGWNKLGKLLPSALDGGPNEGKLDGIRVLTRLEDIVTRAAELYSAPKTRLRGTETGVFPTRPSGDRVRVPPPTALRGGARFQMIYEIDYQRTNAGASIIERSQQAGEEIRLRHRLPMKMLHVDDAIALVATDRAGQHAVLVQAPAVVAMLAEWFDLLWENQTTMTYPVGGTDTALNSVQRDVLKLMLANDDETIARRLRMSVTTVRRHIKAIYQALGVNSRFAAGMAAAKLNWI